MSPSPLKSEAARVNGAQSNGPVTAEGKAASAMNALRHGFTSKQVVLPGEDQAAFDRLRADCIKRFRPQGELETELVETIAASTWRLKRVMQMESNLLTGENTDPLKALSLLMRYENQLNRTLYKAIDQVKELIQIRAQLERMERRRNEPKDAAKPANMFEGMSEKEMELAIHQAMRAPLPGEKAL